LARSRFCLLALSSFLVSFIWYLFLRVIRLPQSSTLFPYTTLFRSEMEVRDYVIGLIKDTYRAFGFSSIETPCVEHIENLCSKQGGDNEKLIFKILKRGEKLKIGRASCREREEKEEEDTRVERQEQEK